MSGTTRMKKEYIIEIIQGIHLRPASKIVEICRNYEECEITIYRDDLTANAKSIMGILGLGISPGTRIEVEATGPEEKVKDFFENFEELIEEKFGDDE